MHVDLYSIKTNSSVTFWYPEYSKLMSVTVFPLKPDTGSMFCDRQLLIVLFHVLLVRLDSQQISPHIALLLSFFGITFFPFSVTMWALCEAGTGSSITEGIGFNSHSSCCGGNAGYKGNSPSGGNLGVAFKVNLRCLYLHIIVWELYLLTRSCAFLGPL